MRYLNVPITDALSYSAVWARNLFRYFGVFLMKRMINSSFSAGSGDVYFLLWTVRTLRVTYWKAFSAGKDVTLLSAAAANAVAVVVLGAYLAFGDLSLMQSVRPGVLGLVIGVTLASRHLPSSGRSFSGEGPGDQRQRHVAHPRLPRCAKHFEDRLARLAVDRRYCPGLASGLD